MLCKEEKAVKSVSSVVKSDHSGIKKQQFVSSGHSQVMGIGESCEETAAATGSQGCAGLILTNICQLTLSQLTAFSPEG